MQNSGQWVGGCAAGVQSDSHIACGSVLFPNVGMEVITFLGVIPASATMISAQSSKCRGRGFPTLASTGQGICAALVGVAQNSLQ